MPQSTVLSLGFSPCPNDTFIFDALVHQKIDTEGLQFDYLLADVEELNRKAFKAELQVSKLSFHAFLYLSNQYRLLDSGAALGFGAGPLLVSKNHYSVSGLDCLKIAIPGHYTTANLLFSLAFPHVKNKMEVLYSDIEIAILNDTVDAGIIIHEGRFTYAEKGLQLIMDLGRFWEEYAQAPIPLGGICVRRDVPLETMLKLNRVLKRSIEYAYRNFDLQNRFIRGNAQELSEQVVKQHIDLYVNQYSISLQQKGREAVEKLFEKALETGLLSHKPDSIFVLQE